MESEDAAFTEALAIVFNRVATNAADAMRRNEGEKFEALVSLTIALEKAYPDQMAQLRRGDRPCCPGP